MQNTIDNTIEKKRKNNEDEYDIAPKHFKFFYKENNDQKRLIIILENAQLETIKEGTHFELLNCDDHKVTLRKEKRDPGTCRPDILHQCLLMLMDSPLNRAGLLQVYVHTEKNVLIEINPQTRIPRTFKRFAGLMVQLLHKYIVRATGKQMKLLKVIRNPVTNYLPVGCRKLLMSFDSKCVVKPKELVPLDNKPIAIVVGAMARGQAKTDYTENTFSISYYPLSGALTCTKLCSAFEETWGVL